MSEDPDKVLTGINKKFGPGTSFFLGSFKGQNVPTISTSLMGLDAEVGGGFPRGKVVEIYGPEASGKTTLALHVVKEAMKSGSLAAFCDAEHALNFSLVTNMKIDLDRFAYSQPGSGEQGLDIVLEWVKSGVFDVVVVDSVAALVPERELEGEMGDQHMGLQARLIGQSLRKLSNEVSKNDVCLIFINQLRQKIGVMYGNPETTPGGQALKFWSSQRYDVRAYKQIKSGKRVIGREGKITCVKNKIAAPFGQVQTKLYYGKGFDSTYDMLEYGKDIKAIDIKGRTHSIGSLVLGTSKDEVYSNLRKSSKARKKLRSAIKKLKASE